jgi:hypothetical protein
MTELGVWEHAGHSGRDTSACERRLRARIREFDLGALLVTLHHLGYRDSTVLLESNPEETSPESLIEGIRFLAGPPRTAIVTVNMGLLGTQGLLPSYFQREVDKSAEPERFYDFIRFFDDRLLHDRARALYAERNPAAYPDYASTRRHCLGLLGFGSVLTLQRLLRDVFPELAVRVKRVRVRTQVETSMVRMGTSHLNGSAVLGGYYGVEPAGLSVDLVCEDGVMDSGDRWPSVAVTRLKKSVFPLLAPHRIALTVRLTTLAHANWVRVEEDEEEPLSELGFDRVQGRRERRHTVVLFEGIP